MACAPFGRTATVLLLALAAQKLLHRMARPSNRMLLIVVVALIAVAGGISYWRYSSHQKQELRQAVVALLNDSSARMRDAVGIETAPPTLDRSQFVKKLSEHAATAERNLQLLRRLETARDRPLADAADDYLLAVREILKRQLDSHRHRQLLTANLQVLANHMHASSRTSEWTQDAVKAKEQVNQDYRSFSLAIGAYGKLIESFPASQKRIAPYVEKVVLIEDSLLAEAHRRALAAARQLAAEMDRIKQPEAMR